MLGERASRGPRATPSRRGQASVRATPPRRGRRVRAAGRAAAAATPCRGPRHRLLLLLRRAAACLPLEREMNSRGLANEEEEDYFQNSPS